MNWPLLQNSLLVSGAATLLALALGTATALWLAGLPPAARRVGLAGAVIALALPPFLVTGCWIDLLGHTGAWRSWLPFDIYSHAGTAWVLALLFWPVTALLVLGRLRQLDASLLEADTSVTGKRLFLLVLLPFLRPTLALAGTVTLVLALNQFSVPAILQTKVFPAEVWVTFNTSFDHRGALWLSWPLMLGPLLLLWLLRGHALAWPAAPARDLAPALKRQSGRRCAPALAAAGTVTLLLSIALPLARLALEERTWTELSGALAAGKTALLNSAWFALTAATLTCAAGVWLRRWRMGGVLWLLFLVPGVLLGIGLILLLNHPGTAWFYQGTGVVLLALGLRYLAMARAGAARALASLDRDLAESARLAGAAGWRLFREVHWPQVAGPLLAVWYAVYLLCLWDVETLVLIVPPGGETLALRIFNLLHYGHNAQVNALCVALLGLAVAPLIVAGVWNRMQPDRNDR
jgi:iron(III) transport system permease protein